MRALARLALALACLVPAAGLAQRSITVDVIPDFVGLGIGKTTEWAGSKDYVAGVVPGARMRFDTHRFAELYGPYGDVNLLDIANWELGPAVNYRLGRKDVQDPVVNLLPPIDGGLEGGFFAGYNYTKLEGVPWRVRAGVSVLTGMTGDAHGTTVIPYASFWLPLSHTVFVGLGGGATWSSRSFMQERFGVTPAASAASGLPVFEAGAGVRQTYVWPALVVRLGERWFLGGGALYQRLTGDAADSPIVAQRGTRGQWSAGIGLGYAFR